MGKLLLLLLLMKSFLFSINLIEEIEYNSSSQQEVPSILIELGFLSNDSELLQLINLDNKIKMAKAIKKSVYDFIK